MWTIRTWIHFSDRSNPFIFPYFDWFWVSGKFLLEKNTNLKLFTFLDLHKCIKNTLLLKRRGISWNLWDKFMHLHKLVLVKKGNSTTVQDISQHLRFQSVNFMKTGWDLWKRWNVSIHCGLSNTHKKKILKHNSADKFFSTYSAKNFT